MASGKSAHRRKRRPGGARAELNVIRILGCSAIVLGLVALAIIGFRLIEGEQAGSSAEALLAAYRAQPTPDPTATAAATEEIPSPEPGDEDLELTDANADLSAAVSANEHLASDGTNAVDYETGEYVRPDAPEVDTDLQNTIQKIVDAAGEDGVIGILEIPDLGVELPIIGKWSYKLLKISVCRYKGPTPNTAGNLVLIGHNYKSGAHFGNLSELSVGDEIYLTDSATNTRMRYEVYQVKSIAPDAFSALKSYHGEYGLTLMTCKDNGTNRLLVRCEQKAASSNG